MSPTNDEPFDRESWRRLLAADAGGPPQETDRHILAEARRAHRPRLARWYLPASLAASLLLAVFIVQWQLEDSSAPGVMTESDVLPPPTPAAIESHPAVPAASVESPRREVPAEAPPAAAPPVAAPAPAPSPRISVREREQPAAMESRADAASVVPAQAEPARELGKFQALKESSATPRDPDRWYADIEALRAAGRIEEADAELARFEAAWPGWLASHRQQQ